MTLKKNKLYELKKTGLAVKILRIGKRASLVESLEGASKGSKVKVRNDQLIEEVVE
jgi:hypothetical protein